MVERIKQATDKARARRARLGGGPIEVAVEDAAPSGIWARLDEQSLDLEHMKDARIPSFRKCGPAHTQFDMLRTSLLRILREQGWTRIGITSATASCGKTLVSTNLAFSFSRYKGIRTLLMDLDLRAPQIAGRLGLDDARSLEKFLCEELSPENYLVRAGNNLALGLNSDRAVDGAELLQRSTTGRSLNRMLRELAPDVVLYDLPPLFGGDDTVTALQYVDCVLLVASSGVTTSDQIAECEKLLEDGPDLLGVILNDCDIAETDRNSPGYYGSYA